MICRRRTTASVILVSVTLGCSSQDPLESSGTAELGATTPEVPGGTTPEVLECPMTNVLLRVPYDTTCRKEYPGEKGSWIGRAVTPTQSNPEERRPRFCGYYWNAPGKRPDTRVLPGKESARPGVLSEEVGPVWQWDCARVGAHGAREDLYAALSAHGNHMLEDDFEWTTTTENPVRVAVIDTAAGTWSDRDNNPHGKAVGTLVRDTACVDANCKVKVENYLGLPLIRVNAPGSVVVRQDLVRGGAFGSHGDLARAIVEAVDDDPDPTKPTPTVINLSVAYDSDELLSTGEPDPNDFENAVVLEALRYARCHGALILAAAGNGRVPALDEQKPALPARWTALQALDAAACHDRYNVTPTVSGGPLLYAVSGVDFGARPLLNTRGRGQSVLTALGFAAVREDPDGGFTRILSGSSMATATVSGLAAALWSHVPAGTTGDEIIRALYDVSDGIAAGADFAPYQPRNTKFFDSARRLTRRSIANSAFGVARCSVVDPVTTVPDSVVPDLPEGALDGTKVNDYAPEPGIYPLDFPWLRPQPEGEPGCTSCSLKLLQNRIDLILRSGFSAKTSTLRLLVKKSNVAGIANLTSSDPLEVVADFDTKSVPYTVDLGDAELGTTTAAELTYQIDVDGVTVDMNESVLLE